MAGPTAAPEGGLVRALGVRGLAANIVNTTIGAGIFVLPAAVAASLGAAAPLAYLVCAATMGLIMTCFAMAGSRVSVTGGPYAYVEVAFGRFVGFLAGVLLWLSCILAAGSVASAFAGTVGLLLSPVAGGLGRLALLAAVFVGLAAVNVRGVRSGARLVELVTAAKLLPLVLFVLIGLLSVKRGALGVPPLPPVQDLGATVLLLIFAFVGPEVALVPSGEVKDPARTVPRAIYVALSLTTLLYLSIQLVAQGVLGSELARHAEAPLAEASARFLGVGGRALVLAGTAVSMFGYVSGDMLGSPRALFALGRDGILPSAFARVHPRYRTPHLAILFHAALGFGLASVGSFTELALLSNVAVLTVYLACCAGAWRLARLDVRSEGTPFSVPGGALLPALACLAVLWILSNATWAELRVEALVLAVATLLYGLRALRQRRTRV